MMRPGNVANPRRNITDSVGPFELSKEQLIDHADKQVDLYVEDCG